ncbi:trypsin-like serine protease [Ningiella sp. W23]|uniref:trypsin-like serine protease n=1 Tax=Ningiella sp. W23 TaxID=3023715 RepID=UPI003757D178
MNVRKGFTIAAVALTVSVGTSFVAHAGLIASGSSGGFSWEARSTLVGAADGGTGQIFPTDPLTADFIGNPQYHPSYPEYSGVVGMLMETAEGNFICSGTLMEDRRSILTAAHCVSGGAGTPNPISTTVFFQPEGGLNPDERIYNVPAPEGTVEIEVAEYIVNPDYTGEVIDQNDIAILRLEEEAPLWATSYGIYTEDDIAGQEFNVAGYGRLGTGEGSVGLTGRLRQGDNMYDYAWGEFGDFFTDGFFGTADVEFSYVSDFDNGLAANDTSGLIANALGVPALFNDVGLGDREVGVAGGDSGGPNFIRGLISGVNSYGLSFGADFGDAVAGLNNSFGEFSGYVPTYIHADFIANNLVRVSAPGILALMTLGMFGVAARARRKAA